MNTQKDAKKKVPVWVWIVGALLLFSFFGNLVGGDDETIDAEEIESSQVETSAIEAEVVEEQPEPVEVEEVEERPEPAEVEEVEEETQEEKEQAECLIKGNISRSGERIYHVPGGQNYSRTKITVSKGERMFCSEGEARAAGWRRSFR